MTKVLRMVPITFFPYIVFSPYAPRALCNVRSGSESSGKESAYLSRKPPWLFTESLETPTTCAPALANAFAAAENACASLVHPGVLSFG